MISPHITPHMTYKKIVKSVLSKKVNCEEALQLLSELGFCPNVINDDNGHWAVLFDGFQVVPSSAIPEELISTFYIEQKYWKDTIYEALVYSLTEDQL